MPQKNPFTSQPAKEIMIGDVFRLIGHWLGSVPFLIVLVCGAIVCLRRLNERPTENWLVGLAIVLLLCNVFGRPFAFNFIVSLVGGRGIGPDFKGISVVGVLSGLVSSITSAASWGLVLYVAFGLESAPRSRYLIEDDHESAEASR